jgi:hypothetical protein
MKHTGPMLFNNSLRDWQARYKARRAATASEAPRAGATAEGEPPPAAVALAGGQGTGREVASGR